MTPVLDVTFRDVAGDPWEGSATVRFQDQTSPALPVREGMTSAQRTELRWYIEEFMDLPEGGNVPRASRVEEGLVHYGGWLWQGLQQAGIIRNWLGAVQTAGEGRLELRADAQPDEIALRTPWELMRAGSAGEGGPLLHELGVGVVRRVKAERPRPQPPDTSQGLRVLAIVCRPTQAGFLDPRYTPEAILTALESRPEVTVDFCRPGTLNALRRTLEQAKEAGRPYHVVHFDGHGTTLPMQGNVGALCFEWDDGGRDDVLASDFGEVMSRFNIPLVVLEACRSASKMSAQDTVAGALLRTGVGTVLAMGHAVHVDMTRALMAAFYEGIARGWPLGRSLQAARSQLYANPQRRTRIATDAATVALLDWFVPQLYQGGEDPTLLERKPAGAKRRPQPLFAGFPPEPRAGFQGRGYELHKLERAVLGHRAVVIHAPGGMGKTALAREAALWWTRTGMFPDGAAFLSLEGNPSPERLVSQLGEALDGLEFHKRPDPRQWLEGELARRRMLVVWDNYESVLPAFSGRPTPPDFGYLARDWTRGESRLLVTCRDPEIGFEAQPFPLGELTPTEGLTLLVGYLDRLKIDRARREKEGWTGAPLEPIVQRTGGHPLALELVAPHIPDLGPAQVVKELSTLLAQSEQEHPEARNRSMWASLDFSIRHLSAEARAALPAAALLSGGCLENMAAMVVGLEPGLWLRVREELERTGLVRLDGGFFKPHPILGDLLPPPLPSGEGRGEGEPVPIAAPASTVPPGLPALQVSPETEHRFLEIVVAFARQFDQLVRTPHAKIALAAMAGTEVVVHRGVDRALAARSPEAAWAIADSLRLFLERTGRGGKAAAIIADLDARLGRAEGEITQTAAQVACQSAWARAPADAAGAVRQLERLLAELRVVRGWDARHEQAMALMTLGRIRYGVESRPGEAIERLQQAARLFEEVEREGKTDSANRAATLGDLANAYMGLGRFDEALKAGEEALVLDRQRNDLSAVARGEGIVAQILQDQGRYAEAENRHHAALAAAREAGDDEAAAITWQLLGNLAAIRGHLEEAVESLGKALEAFGHAANDHGRMQVLNSLGEVERHRGNAEAALAWYEKSLELAKRLGSLEGQAVARTNRAVVLSGQAQQAADPDTKRRLLTQAIAEERESLALKQQLGQPARIATSQNNLADHLRLAGHLDEAEHQAQQALAMRTRLKHPETWRTLWILGQIAQARGDTAAAADFRRRMEAARAEADQLAGPPSLPVEAVAALLQVALAAREAGVALADALRDAVAGDPEAVLAQIDQRDPWLSAHLRALASGGARPDVAVPPQYADLVRQAWDVAS